MSEGIVSMKKEIHRRAIEESKSILSYAEQEAKKILSSAKERGDKIRMDIIKPEATTMRRRILGSAELEGRRITIKTKEEVIFEVFDAVKDSLSRVANRKDEKFNYDEIFFKLIKEAASEIDEKKLLITANKNDLSFITSNLNSMKQRLKKELGHEVDLTIMDEPYNCIGGVIVYNSDKSKTFYNTLEGRLLNLRSTLRGKISKILFEKI